MKKVLNFVKKLMASMSVFLVGLSTKVFALDPLEIQALYGPSKVPRWYDGIVDAFDEIGDIWDYAKAIILLPLILIILLIGMAVYIKKKGKSEKRMLIFAILLGGLIVSIIMLVLLILYDM